MLLFKKKEDDINVKSESSDVKKKRLEDVLALQKRHPFLDRFLMLVGIGAIILISIPFIYISFELSVFNIIGGGFDNYMNGTDTMTGILQLFDSLGTNMVPIFQISWDSASWIFGLIGTLLFIGIIVGLVFLFTIYIRDFVTIVKGIMLMLSKNTESTSGIVKEQVSDARKVIASEQKQTKTGRKKKTTKLLDEAEKDRQKELDEEKELDKKIEQVKEELRQEKEENEATINKSSSLDDLNDSELDKLLTGKY